MIQSSSTLDADSYTISLLGNWNKRRHIYAWHRYRRLRGHQHTQILNSAGAGETFNNFYG